MKKLFIITIILLFFINLSQAQTPKDENRGAVQLTGLMIDGGLNLVSDDFKRPALVIKAEQWTKLHYPKYTLTDKDAIYIETNKYNLLLEFKDGVYRYTFTDDSKMRMKKEQKIIDDLSEYLKRKGV